MQIKILGLLERTRSSRVQTLGERERERETYLLLQFSQVKRATAGGCRPRESGREKKKSGGERKKESRGERKMRDGY